jgi:catalase
MMVKYVGPATGDVKSSSGQAVTAEFTFENSRSTYFDAIIFVGGPDADFPKKLKVGRLIHAVREAYMHKKTIGATGNAVKWVTSTCLPGDVSYAAGSGVALENGVVLAEDVGTGAEFAKTFMDGVKAHRVWDREVSHIAA